MRIDGLMLTAFGRFHDRNLDLRPGMNMIWGENESGKSTIQKFMLGMLYGFKKRGQRREYTEDLARFRPWTGDEYRGALLYALDATRQGYRVERTFDPAREFVRLYDATTGADLTASFPMDRRKEVLFAEEQLRLSAEVFTSTAWVGQMEVGRLEMGRELVQRVSNLSESGREDISVRAALRQIEDRIREIGSDRAPTKPYARVCRSIEERRQELDRAQRVRQQTLEWEEGLRQAKEAIGQLDSRVAEGQRQLAWVHLREAEERYERIRLSTAQMEAAGQRAQELSSFSSFPIDMKGQLKEWLEQVTRSAAALEQHRERLTELQASRVAVEAKLQRLQGVTSLGADGIAEVAAAIRLADAGAARLPGLREEADRLAEMIGRIEETMAPMATAAATGADTLVQIDDLEQEIAAARGRLNQPAIDRLRENLAQLDRQGRTLGGGGWAALAAVLLLVSISIGVATALTGSPSPGVAFLAPVLDRLLPASYRWPAAGGFALLGVAAAIPYLLARRVGRVLNQDRESVRGQLKEAQDLLSQESERIRRLEKQRELLFRGLGVVSVTELRNQVVRYEQLAARRDGQVMRRESVLAEIRRAEEEIEGRGQLGVRLSAILAEVGVADGAPLERLQEAMGQYQSARLEYEAVERELAELEQRAAQEEQRLAVARAESEAILQEAGVADAQGYDLACAKHEEWRKAAQEAEGLRNALSALLGGEDGQELAGEVERLRTAATGQLPTIQRSGAELQAEIRRLEGERSEWNARASDLAARVETAVSEIADTADLEREIAALTEEKRAMEEELAALELARTVIDEVSSQIHREFAPRLNLAMGRAVARLTGGRYRTVRIDEELRIRAIAEGDRTVEVTALSGGTIDQFYLALRVAILDLLTEAQERIPLLLDDPFVQYDNGRLRSAMEYLAEASKERQVVLMTCHRRELEMGRELGAHIIEL